MISAKLLRSLATIGKSPGVRKKRIWSEEAEGTKYILGGGVSKLPFVHAHTKTPNLWTVSFQLDGYSFRLGLKNRVLAGFVARLIHAAADPEMSEERGGVNPYCEWPAPETEYRAHNTSLFRLKLPDGDDQKQDSPSVVVVDDWVADRMRGYPWFECNQKGMPDSWAVRPVVMVNRARRSISVSWVTIESVIFPRRVKPLEKKMKPRDMGFTRDSHRYVDLRVGGRKGFPLWSDLQLAVPTVKKVRGRHGAFALSDTEKILPREGKVRVQRTEKVAFSIVVEQDLTENHPIRWQRELYARKGGFGDYGFDPEY
jgi:hypothetical protein